MTDANLVLGFLDRERFGKAPSEFRASLRARRSETQRPELRPLAQR